MLCWWLMVHDMIYSRWLIAEILLCLPLPRLLARHSLKQSTRWRSFYHNYDDDDDDDEYNHRHHQHHDKYHHRHIHQTGRRPFQESVFLSDDLCPRTKTSWFSVKSHLCLIEESPHLKLDKKMMVILFSILMTWLLSGVRGQYRQWLWGKRVRGEWE